MNSYNDTSESTTVPPLTESIRAFRRLEEQRRAATLLPRQEVQEWMNSDLDLLSTKTIGQSDPIEHKTKFEQYIDQVE